ncbi:MAG: IclR family transcriptional regulator [Nocardioides sp.]|nr:IclR family transcriptional regulator [Nocardioides sp.]
MTSSTLASEGGAGIEENVEGVGGVESDDDLWVQSTPRRSTTHRTDALRSVNIALDVLECFATDTQLGVSDVARRLDIAKSTAHRMLTVLTARGFTEQVPSTGKYRLGIHVYELGQLAQDRNRLRHQALPSLRYLSETTGLAVNFAVPEGPDVVFLERFTTPDLEDTLGRTGRRLPAHVTSSGKVIAAFNPTLDRARRAAGFPPRVSRTVRSEADWDRELAFARRHGYATSESESFNDVSTVAVAIRNIGGIAVASLSLMGPTARIHSDVPRLAQLLTAESRRLGRMP